MSHAIEPITVFRVPSGQTFATEEKARAFLENTLESFLRAHVFTSCVLGPKDTAKLTEAIISNRATLAKMLDF